MGQRRLEVEQQQQKRHCSLPTALRCVLTWAHVG
jgi:hypothetical protein